MVLSCVQARSEPPWLEACAKDLGKWAELLDSIQGLALRSAALESLLEVRCPCGQSLAPWRTLQLWQLSGPCRAQPPTRMWVRACAGPHAEYERAGALGAARLQCHARC